MQLLDLWRQKEFGRKFREFNFDRFPREYRHRVYTPDASNLVLEFLFSSLFGEGKGRRVWPCILARPIHDEGAINESDTGSYKPPLFVKGEGVDFGKADNKACSTIAPLFPIISLPFSFSSSSSRDMLPISINY